MNEADTCRKFVVQAAGWDERGIDFQHVAAEAGQSDSLSASNREKARARCRILNQATFFDYCAKEACEILTDRLEKCAGAGELQLVAVRKHLPDVLKVRPISQQGNAAEIIGKFGGADQLPNAMSQRQTLLHAA